MTAIGMNSNLNGSFGLGFSAPQPSTRFAINAYDINRYRSFKKRQKHDVIPNWMIARAVEAVLGDSLIIRMMGGFAAKLLSHDPDADLANTVEDLTEMFQNACEIGWDMATGDDVSSNHEYQYNSEKMEKSPITDDNRQNLPEHTADKMQSWRQNRQDSLKNSPTGYRPALQFAAP